MTTLTYATNVTIDGYIEDESGRFDFFPVDDEVFAAHTDLMRSVGTLLYGRRLYEAMAVWETNAQLAAHSTLFADFAAAWRTPRKIVYSRTLTAPATSNTRIESDFDPAALQELKATASQDLLIGGPDLAAHAFQAGLVDEVHLYVLPIVIGGGKPGLPPGTRADLELLDEHRFGNGVVRLRYRTRES